MSPELKDLAEQINEMAVWWNENAPNQENLSPAEKFSLFAIKNLMEQQMMFIDAMYRELKIKDSPIMTPIGAIHRR